MSPILDSSYGAPPEPEKPSAPIICATPATAPSPPHAPAISARDRRQLTVRCSSIAKSLDGRGVFSLISSASLAHGYTHAVVSDSHCECGMQFKWRPPLEPGGPAISYYRFQMSPPPALQEDFQLDEVSLCNVALRHVTCARPGKMNILSIFMDDRCQSRAAECVKLSLYITWLSVQGFAEVYQGRETRCKVPKLTAGTTYIVRVKVSRHRHVNVNPATHLQLHQLNPDEDGFSRLISACMPASSCNALHAKHEMLRCVMRPGIAMKCLTSRRI